MEGGHGLRVRRIPSPRLHKVHGHEHLPDLVGDDVVAKKAKDGQGCQILATARRTTPLFQTLQLVLDFGETSPRTLDGRADGSKGLFQLVLLPGKLPVPLKFDQGLGILQPERSTMRDELFHGLHGHPEGVEANAKAVRQRDDRVGRPDEKEIGGLRELKKKGVK